MTTRLVPGARTWSSSTDEDNHREYKLKYLVECERGDGPASVRLTPGLPLVGAPWTYGSEVDLAAWRRPGDAVSIHEEKEGEWPTVCAIELTFSTKPGKKCSEQQFEDPLTEPPDISGSGVEFTEEATHDRFGRPITNSALEQIRGPQNEWPDSRPQIVIKMNVPALDVGYLAAFANKVNDAPLWGCRPRTILSKAPTWERKFYGQCNVYYTVTLTFVLNHKTWDRDLLDEGTKCVIGEWVSVNGNGEPPFTFVVKTVEGEPLTPEHGQGALMKYQDPYGNVTRTVLDGHGRPYVPPEAAGTGEADLFWWCINNGFTGIVFEGDCAQATDYAIAEGALLDGPYETEEEAAEGCVGGGLGGGVGEDPNSFPCDDDSATPGRVPVQKYGEANFLLLGIPLTF